MGHECPVDTDRNMNACHGGRLGLTLNATVHCTVAMIRDGVLLGRDNEAQTKSPRQPSSSWRGAVLPRSTMRGPEGSRFKAAAPPCRGQSHSVFPVARPNVPSPLSVIAVPVAAPVAVLRPVTSAIPAMAAP